jgi:hypothetical protein
MTVPEYLNAHSAAVHPSRLRAPERNAEVRSNSDHHRDNAAQKMQNGRAFCSDIRVRDAQAVAACPCKLQTDQLLAIQIP